MPLLTVCGQECVGKTHLINTLEKRVPGRFFVRHWNVAQDTAKFSGLLTQDLMQLRADPDFFIIYEGCWTLTLVYNDLGYFKSSESSFVSEWRYGRAVDTVGLRIMLHTNAMLDTPMGMEEKLWYFQHGRKYGYLNLINNFTQESADENVDTIFSALRSPIYMPPAFVGKPKAKIIFVHSHPHKGKATKAAERVGMQDTLNLPMSYPYDTFWAENIGPELFQCAFVEWKSVPTNIVRQFPIAVTLTDDADRWCRTHVQHHNIVRVKGPEECRINENTKRTHVHRDEQLKRIQETKEKIQCLLTS